MILFQKIKWKNFLSTGQHFTEVNLNTNSSVLIIGDNGAGKSTILDALSFVLYGKPFRKINKNQLLNSINGKGAVVEVEFKIGRHQYKIVRGIKPNTFEIWQNDKMINQDAAARDYQEMLEKQILKLNHKSFSQIVVLGSATFTPFMQLSAANRREVIEDILDIGIFSIMNTLLKDKVQVNKNELQDAKYQVDLIEQKIEMAEAHQEELKKLNKGQIDKLMEKVSTLQHDKKQAEQSIASLLDQSQQLEQQTSDHQEINKKIKQIEKLRQQLNDKYRSISKDIEFYENHDNCPTCKQGIDHDFKQTTVDTKLTRQQEIEDATKQLEQQYEQLTVRLEEISQLVDQIANINREVSDINVKINIWNQSMDSLQKEIDHIQQTTQMSDDNAIKQLKKDKSAQDKLYEQLADDREVLGIASNILRDTGIKSKIIKQYIPVINKLINKYLAAMDFFVQFELDENFNETIRSRFRDAFSYASFSEGEKMRIDLSLLFTWRAIAKLRNSVSTNLLIMDEVFDSSLDSGGTEEFMKILGQLTQDTNVFIISHKGDQLFDKFETVIRFEKHQNFSRIAA